MPKIENVSFTDVEGGYHLEVNDKTILIQIVDPGVEFPKPQEKFDKIYRFQFLDIEQNHNYKHHLKITDQQANELGQILKMALQEERDVVVHCMAGVCRSGAVAEVGIIMGFEDTYAHRSPNLMVKHKMLEQLGLPYDPQEPFTVNGRAFEYDELNNKIWLDEKGE